MCTDFYNLGLTEMIVDPGVRVAYDLQTAQQLYTSKVMATIPCMSHYQSSCLTYMFTMYDFFAQISPHVYMTMLPM